jgi:methoxymalonate biosynthesis acyl carrier protein
MTDRRSRIRAFLATYLRDPDLQPDTNIFISGLADSLFATQLVMFIERDFAIEIANEDLEIENFSSLDALDRFVGRKLGEAPG